MRAVVEGSRHTSLRPPKPSFQTRSSFERVWNLLFPLNSVYSVTQLSVTSAPLCDLCVNPFLLSLLSVPSSHAKESYFGSPFSSYSSSAWSIIGPFTSFRNRLPIANNSLTLGLCFPPHREFAFFFNFFLPITTTRFVAFSVSSVLFLCALCD